MAAKKEPSQPTIPPAGQYGATETPSGTPTTPTTIKPTPAAGGKISPDVQKGLLSEDGGDSYQYAIGVKGKRIFDDNGNIVRYEGYKYYTQPRYGTTSGAGAATGTQMVPGVAGQAFEPKYFSGDEDQIYGYSSEQVANLQKAMNAVGLLGGKYSPGVVDNSTRAAYANLLEQANGYGEDADAAIMRLASAGGRGGGSLTQYRVSNETDIKNVISRVAKQTIGRNLGEGDLNRLAQMYKQLEKEAGLAAGSSTQQEVMAAPSPEAFAQSELEKMLPEETNARQFGSYLDAIKEKYQI